MYYEAVSQCTRMLRNIGKRSQNRPSKENEPRQYLGMSLQRVEVRLDPSRWSPVFRPERRAGGGDGGIVSRRPNAQRSRQPDVDAVSTRQSEELQRHSEKQRCNHRSGGSAEDKLAARFAHAVLGLNR